MGELIIRIDQETGAVLKVAQKLDSNVRKILKDKLSIEPEYLDKLISINIRKELERSDPDAARQLEATMSKIKEWLDQGEQCDSITVTLPPLGNLYNSKPFLVKELLEIRDRFERFVPLPLELWQKKGNTVCKMECGGVTHVCVH